jgi:hypothetical protein
MMKQMKMVIDKAYWMKLIKEFCLFNNISPLSPPSSSPLTTTIRTESKCF